MIKGNIWSVQTRIYKMHIVHLCVLGIVAGRQHGSPDPNRDTGREDIPPHGEPGLRLLTLLSSAASSSSTLSSSSLWSLGSIDSTVRMMLVLRPPKIDDISPSKFLIQHTEWFDAPLLAQACKCFDTENAFPHVQLLLLPSRKCFSCLELFHKTFAQSNVWNIAQPFFLRRGHKMLDALGWERRKLSRDLEIGQAQSQ